MAELDDYLELLYDDLPAKIKGTGMILQLARSPEHLHELALNGELVLCSGNGLCPHNYCFYRV